MEALLALQERSDKQIKVQICTSAMYEMQVHVLKLIRLPTVVGRAT